MNKCIISDYLRYHNLNNYPNFSIDDIKFVDSTIIFFEDNLDNTKEYKSHRINFYDILTFMYNIGDKR